MARIENAETEVRTDAGLVSRDGYADFIREVATALGYEVDALTFDAVVELTRDDPKRGLGIAAYRASDAYRAAKDDAKAKREADRARAADEKRAKELAKVAKAKADLAARARELGIDPAALFGPSE